MTGHSKRKGEIVEEVVSLLHQQSGLNVRRNVRLPTIDGSGRKREIDVLLEGEVAGYPIRFAIECKNVEKPVGSPLIDQFCGKLRDVGIPCSYGIFVSAMLEASNVPKAPKFVHLS